MRNITNPIFNEFFKLKLVKKKNIIKINNTTRDKKIKVYQDKKSFIIFLEKYLTNFNYYSSIKKIDQKKTKNKIYSLINITNGKTIKTQMLDDNERRYLSLKKYFYKKSVLDFGCGWGGFLSLLKNYSDKCSGLEIRKNCINYIKRKNKFIDIQSNINQFKQNFDVITLFHVLEHMPNQVDSLKLLKKRIKKGGKIIIEVPSAQDYLISLNKLPEFKKFTFWSEHLVLHTEKSLKKVLSVSGFKKIKISHFQRYGYANHMGWLLNKKPGGHEYFGKDIDKRLDNFYKRHLIKTKQADTLIAIAKN